MVVKSKACYKWRRSAQLSDVDVVTLESITNEREPCPERR